MVSQIPGPVIDPRPDRIRRGRRALRYILVGTGGWGAHWCESVLPRLTAMRIAVPVAVADVNAGALETAQRYLGVAAADCYTSAEDAFAARAADFAIIVVPPRHHEAIVDLAVAHGLHILSEKPIADSMAACCRIYHKARAARKKMAVTMSHRFDQDKQTLQAAVNGGEYGALNYVVCRFTHNCREFGSWGRFRHEMADPLLIEGAVHHLDVFRALAGADARAVYARTWNPPWGQFAGDSTALITIEMTNGVRCFYEGAKANAATLNGWANEYFRAECENGSLELDRRTLRVAQGGAWEEPSVRALPLLDRPVWMNAWLAEWFCEWLNGGPPPPTHIDDNIQCAALLFAAVESAHSGAVVDVQAFARKHLEQAAIAPARAPAPAVV